MSTTYAVTVPAPPTTEDLAIDASGLAKSYRGVPALRGIDLRVPRGTVFALLGPNGAGKTTAVRILATLQRADAGRARVAGFDVTRDRHQVRRRISVTGQFAALDGALTGAENLRMIARLAGLPRAAAARRAVSLLEQFELTEAAGRRVGTYSGGMSRRLDLAASLVVPPSVLFLDEPTTGLDPQSRLITWRIVAGLASSGMTVFLTTQYLEEADQLAGRIAVLDGGRLVGEGTAAELKRKVAATRLDLTCRSAAAFEQVSRILGRRAVHLDPAALTVGAAIDDSATNSSATDGSATNDRATEGSATEGSAAQVRALLDEADPDRDLIASFAVREATLDDVFFALTGGSHA